MTAPDWLSPAALDVFERTAAELDEHGRNYDPNTLAVYANAVVQHAEASKLIDRSAMLVRGEGDRLVRNPAQAVVRDAAATVSRLARQLGLATIVEPSPRGGKPRRGKRNAQAVERTIVGLKDAGRLERCDDATIELCRTLAVALDQIDPNDRPAQLASIARAHLAALRLLRGVGDDEAGSVALDELLAALGDPTEP